MSEKKDKLDRKIEKTKGNLESAETNEGFWKRRSALPADNKFRKKEIKKAENKVGKRTEELKSLEEKQKAKEVEAEIKRLKTAISELEKKRDEKEKFFDKQSKGLSGEGFIAFKDSEGAKNWLEEIRNIRGKIKENEKLLESKKMENMTSKEKIKQWSDELKVVQESKDKFQTEFNRVFDMAKLGKKSEEWGDQFKSDMRNSDSAKLIQEKQSRINELKQLINEEQEKLPPKEEKRSTNFLGDFVGGGNKSKTKNSTQEEIKNRLEDFKTSIKANYFGQEKQDEYKNAMRDYESFKRELDKAVKKKDQTAFAVIGKKIDEANEAQDILKQAKGLSG